MLKFPGWTLDDYTVFEIPEFEQRMRAIRTEIRPRLKLLADDLEPFLGRTGMQWHGHVASHMRRRVNPPEETWVAFGRSRQGYKMYAHLMSGLGADGAFAELVVKADSRDIHNLKQLVDPERAAARAVESARSEASEAGAKLERFDGREWVPLDEAGILVDWAEADRDFRIGRRFSPEEGADGAAYVKKTADTFEALMPFYALAAGLNGPS